MWWCIFLRLGSTVLDMVASYSFIFTPSVYLGDLKCRWKIVWWEGKYSDSFSSPSPSSVRVSMSRRWKQMCHVDETRKKTKSNNSSSLSWDTFLSCSWAESILRFVSFANCNSAWYEKEYDKLCACEFFDARSNLILSSLSLRHWTWLLMMEFCSISPFLQRLCGLAVMEWCKNVSFSLINICLRELQVGRWTSACKDADCEMWQGRKLQSFSKSTQVAILRGQQH